MIRRMIRGAARVARRNSKKLVAGGALAVALSQVPAARATDPTPEDAINGLATKVTGFQATFTPVAIAGIVIGIGLSWAKFAGKKK
jgi:type IV secretory pathway VirB2 component (pilin)